MATLDYDSTYTGAQIDAAVGKALNPDSTPTASSAELITSGGVADAIAAEATRTDAAIAAEAARTDAAVAAEAARTDAAVAAEAARAQAAEALLAPLDSPNFSGIPMVPDASEGANSTQIANTKFVKSAIGSIDKTRYVWFGTCDTDSSVATKAVTVSGITALSNGLRLSVLFSKAEIAQNTVRRLKVNDLADGAIVGSINLTTLVPDTSSISWAAGSVVDFVYQSGSWWVIGQTLADDSTFGKVRLASTLDEADTTAAPSSSAVASYVAKELTFEGGTGLTVSGAATQIGRIVFFNFKVSIPTSSPLGANALVVKIYSDPIIDASVGQRLVMNRSISSTSQDPRFWVRFTTSPSGTTEGCRIYTDEAGAFGTCHLSGLYTI